MPSDLLRAFGLVEINRPSGISDRVSGELSQPASPLHIRLVQAKGRCRCYATSTGGSDILKRTGWFFSIVQFHHIEPKLALIYLSTPSANFHRLTRFSKQQQAVLETCSFPSSGTSTTSRLAMLCWLSIAQIVRPSHSTHLGHGADDISIR